MSFKGLVVITILFLLYSCQKTNPVTPPPVPTVNAGVAQTINAPVDSVSLSGSATDSVSKITAYLWSEVSGPNVPVIASDGSASTEVTGLITGTYVFQLMATDLLGATGVNTVTITVVASKAPGSGTDTLRTIFPGGVYSPYELMILANTSSPAGNSQSPELLAETWTINGIEVFGRSFFEFNMAAIPSGTVVKSATLVLFSDTLPLNGNLVDANYGTNNDFFIQRVAGSWNATTNFNTMPSVDSVGEVHVPQTNQNFLDLSVDVTTMVNNMIANGNYGFVMRLNTEVEYNSRIFCSTSNPDSSRHPYLVVTY